MTVEDIFEEALDVASKLTHISKDNILKRSRKRNIVDARKLSVYYMRSKYSLSWTETSKMFDMNHATVIHHVRQMKNFLEFDKLEMTNYIKVRDYVFEQNSAVTLSEEFDLLKKEKSLLDNRLEQVETELNLLENGN